MPLHVQEEAVLPELVLGGARLDLGQVQVALGEDLQQLQQRSRLVRVDEHHHGGLVPPRGSRDLGPHQHEARAVARGVGDVAGDHLEAVAFGGQWVHDGEVAGSAFGDQLRRTGGGGHRHAVSARQGGRQPAAGRRQRDRVRGDLDDAIQTGPGDAGRDQGDRQLQLTVDQQRGLEGHRVQRGGDRALEGVLDRDDATAGPPLLHGAQHLGDVAARQQVGVVGGTGDQAGGGLRERPGGAEVGDQIGSVGGGVTGNRRLRPRGGGGGVAHDALRRRRRDRGGTVAVRSVMAASMASNSSALRECSLSPPTTCLA